MILITIFRHARIVDPQMFHQELQDEVSL